MTRDVPSASPPARGRLGVAAVAAAALVTAIAAFALALAPPPTSRVTIHGGTDSYVVTTSLNARSGCDVATVTVTDRQGQIVPLDAVELTASMPVMGQLHPWMEAEGSDGNYVVDDFCLSMIGPWEIQLALSSPTDTELLLMPLNVDT